MPMQRDRYPSDWDAIAHMVKHEASWCCEACGRPCREPDETNEAFMRRLSLEQVREYLDRPRRFVLTVAHLNHVPEDCRRENLKALCAPCHGRYDLGQMRRKQMLKREAAGQLSLSLG
mgnify:CR=1 FL=1